jgi:hypothetical protein
MSICCKINKIKGSVSKRKLIISKQIYVKEHNSTKKAPVFLTEAVCFS